MKKYILGSLLGLIAFVIVGGTVALAHGGFGPALDDRAISLDRSTEVLRIQLQNKSLPEIPDEQSATRQQLQEHRLEQQAKLLGITVDELPIRLQDKTFARLLEGKGISHVWSRQMKQEQRQVRMAEYLQQKVDDGTITQEQRQARLDQVAEHESRGFSRTHHGPMMDI